MSKKNHDFGSLVCIYAQLLPKIREAGKRLGYAIAIHGSMIRDLDLLAVPWTTEAAEPAVLLEEIRSAVGGYIIGDGVAANGHVSEEPTKQPHGRLSWNICWGGRPFLDLSVMPRAAGGAAGEQRLRESIKMCIAELREQARKSLDAGDMATSEWKEADLEGRGMAFREAAKIVEAALASSFIPKESEIHPVDLSFASVNEFVHEPDQIFEHLQWLCLSLATALERLPAELAEKLRRAHEYNAADLLASHPAAPSPACRECERLRAALEEIAKPRSAYCNGGDYGEGAVHEHQRLADIAKAALVASLKGKSNG